MARLNNGQEKALFHLTPGGEAKPCHADFSSRGRGCPYGEGGMANHYETENAAREAYERKRRGDLLPHPTYVGDYETSLRNSNPYGDWDSRGLATCPGCDGQGVQGRRSPRGPEYDEDWDCLTCGGAGRVNAAGMERWLEEAADSLEFSGVDPDPAFATVIGQVEAALEVHPDAHI